MRLLLDAHAFLWWVSDWQHIAEPARDAIADPRNEVFVSAVSGWEIAIKKAKGRLVAPDNLALVVEEKGFGHLPPTPHPRGDRSGAGGSGAARGVPPRAESG